MTAAAFRALHAGPAPLRLANAWDAMSARLIEASGGRAIATTSAGVAWSLGYADGQRLPLTRLIEVVRDMLRVVRVPLSVDLERGYFDEPDGVAGVVVELAGLGVAGVNLEDGRGSPSALAAKIEGCRAALARAGLDVFINARTDVALTHAHADAGALLDADEIVRRGALYRSAGADGLFVPALFDVAVVRRVAAEVPLSLNLWCAPGRTSLEALADAGARRFTLGPQTAIAALHAAREAWCAWLAPSTPPPLDYPSINALLG